MFFRFVTNFLLFRLGKTRDTGFPENNFEGHRQGAFDKLYPDNRDHYTVTPSLRQLSLHKI